MVHELSPGKSVCILAIVIGCFAILWPNIFYPMLKSVVFDSADDANGCCDVLSDRDVNGVKLISELCKAVLKRSESHGGAFNSPLGPLTRDVHVNHCRATVLDTCGVDIRILLENKIRLNPSYKHVLEELRTFNKSLCLKYHFDITLDLLGAPHRVKKYNATSSSKYRRQERTSHARHDELLSTFRGGLNKGAQPQNRAAPQVEREKMITPPGRMLSAKKPPIPGMRPPIGGGGHLQSQKSPGTMGVLMPMYTVGIVIFFGYTILKLLCKKQGNSNTYVHDPEFCRIVFNNNSQGGKLQGSERSSGNSAAEPSQKLGWQEKDIRDIDINQLRKRLAETEATMERIVRHMNLVSQSLSKPLNETNELSSEVAVAVADNTELVANECEDVRPVPNAEDEKGDNDNGAAAASSSSKKDSLINDTAEKLSGTIRVVGMEMNESHENGQRWKGLTQTSNKVIPSPKVTPQEIILSGNVPTNSRVFVSDAQTENVAIDASDDDAPVILESKVTLNVILPSLNNERVTKNTREQINYDADEYENGYSNNEDEDVDNTSGLSEEDGDGEEESNEDEEENTEL